MSIYIPQEREQLYRDLGMENLLQDLVIPPGEFAEIDGVEDGSKEIVVSWANLSGNNVVLLHALPKHEGEAQTVTIDPEKVSDAIAHPYMHVASGVGHLAAINALGFGSELLETSQTTQSA